MSSDSESSQGPVRRSRSGNVDLSDEEPPKRSRSGNVIIPDDDDRDDSAAVQTQPSEDIENSADDFAPRTRSRVVFAEDDDEEPSEPENTGSTGDKDESPEPYKADPADDDDEEEVIAPRTRSRVTFGDDDVRSASEDERNESSDSESYPERRSRTGNIILEDSEDDMEETLAAEDFVDSLEEPEDRSQTLVAPQEEEVVEERTRGRSGNVHITDLHDTSKDDENQQASADKETANAQDNTGEETQSLPKVSELKSTADSRTEDAGGGDENQLAKHNTEQKNPGEGSNQRAAHSQVWRHRGSVTNSESGRESFSESHDSVVRRGRSLNVPLDRSISESEVPESPGFEFSVDASYRAPSPRGYYSDDEKAPNEEPAHYFTSDDQKENSSSSASTFIEEEIGHAAFGIGESLTVVAIEEVSTSREASYNQSLDATSDLREQYRMNHAGNLDQSRDQETEKSLDVPNLRLISPSINSFSDLPTCADENAEASTKRHTLGEKIGRNFVMEIPVNRESPSNVPSEMYRSSSEHSTPDSDDSDRREKRKRLTKKRKKTQKSETAAAAIANTSLSQSAHDENVARVSVQQSAENSMEKSNFEKSMDLEKRRQEQESLIKPEKGPAKTDGGGCCNIL